MSRGKILIVGETRSLAESLAGLLESDGLPTLRVPDWRRAVEACGRADAEIAALLVASNQSWSPSLEAWPTSELADRHLIWVGMRGSSLPPMERLHPVTLPLDPAELLALVRSVARVPAETVGTPEPTRPREGRRPPTGAPLDSAAPPDPPEGSGDAGGLSRRNLFVRVELRVGP